MVNQYTHTHLFPGIPYPGPSAFDQYAEPPVLQLAPQGVVASLERMANSLLSPFMPELEALLKVQTATPLSTTWDLQPCGWSTMGDFTPLEYPPTSVGVLDSETLVKVKGFPVMVGYLGSNGVWYCWKTPQVGAYINLKPNSLIVGHNVAFDASLVSGKVWCLDTQVLATQVSGFCTDQQWISYKPVPAYKKPIWALKGYGKGNYKSLADTAEFYLGVKLHKEERNAFVEADTYESLHPEWDKLLSYCANDVLVTHQVLKEVWVKWKAKAPSSVSLWGAIVANSYRVPVDPNWDEWLANTEAVYHKTKQEMVDALEEVAQEWIKEGFECFDPWKCLLDWTVKPRTRKLKGYPEWYRKGCDKGGITLKSALGHTLLKVEYLGKPVRWQYGLGYHTDDGKVPHPNGNDDNVGYLFSQDLTSLFESGALQSKDPRCQRLIELAYSMAYWTAVRKRAMDVRVVDGWVKPMTGGGTVTGRVTEPLWLTTCDPNPKRIGSELKSRIQAPEGFKLVLADFASQEMRIAWLYGDARVGEVGGTAMSKAGIAGDKALGTDCHSLLATYLTQQAGSRISRDTAKTIGYALQYGAGIKKLANSIQMQCPHLTQAECEAIATAARDFRKGRKQWSDGGSILVGGSDSESFNAIADYANADRPRTIILGREMPDPIMPLYVGRDYVTTRGNFTIQATARDQLDILCVAFGYMCTHFGLEAFICWTRHDEVIAYAPDREVDMVVELLQQAHAFTWAALHESLGLHTMPTIGLWFEDINIDTVCRKSVGKSCITPSNTIEPSKGRLALPDQLKGIASWGSGINTFPRSASKI